MNKNLHRRTRQGLTLLELMIVLIILVGLIAIVGPRLLGTQKKADIRTAQAQIGNLASALKMYAVDMKSFPLTEEGLNVLISAPEDEALAKKLGWALYRRWKIAEGSLGKRLSVRVRDKRLGFQVDRQFPEDFLVGAGPTTRDFRRRQQPGRFG